MPQLNVAALPIRFLLVSEPKHIDIVPTQLKFNME
jgi:hypothetical protein